MYKYTIAKVKENSIDTLSLKRLCNTPYNAMKMFLKINNIVKKDKIESLTNEEIKDIFKIQSKFWSVKVVEIKIYN